MRILVVGGTQFVGRHIVESALAAGHEVTVFHRGSGSDDVVPAAEHRHGDRNGDLKALADGEWDATVDVSAYVPRQVSALADALHGRGGHHVYVSTVSVYAPPPGPGITESAAVLEPPPADVEEVTDTTYGGLKVACERAATTAYGDRLAIVRPTYVIGPWDHTGRFTYWVERLARGGEVLAPGPAGAPAQVIDARDQGRFAVGLAERGVRGPFHTVSPAPPFTFADQLEAIASVVAPPGTTLTWVDEDVLLAAGLDGAALPLWTGGEDDAWVMAADPSAATAEGLRPRPLVETVADTHAWAQTQDAPVPTGVGLDPAREAELLASLRG